MGWFGYLTLLLFPVYTSYEMCKVELYICALAVLRVDGDLRDFYQRLRDRGKPGKVAVIAVARKLLMQLNAVARRGTPWMKQYESNCPSYQAGSA